MADERVVIFESAHEGYGDAQRSSRLHSYNRVYGNLDARWPGEISAACAIQTATVEAVAATLCGGPVVFIDEWEDTSDPLIIWVRQAASGADGRIVITRAGSILRAQQLS